MQIGQGEVTRQESHSYASLQLDLDFGVEVCIYNGDEAIYVQYSAANRRRWSLGLCRNVFCC